MKIVCISDTHMLHEQIPIPDGDVLIHAGDFSRRGSRVDLDEFTSWLGSLPHKHKIMIAGNHDFCMEQPARWMLKVVSDLNITYLKDSSVTIDGKLFYGSPWQPEFHNWAFNLPRRGPELRDFWERIPDETDVLITHGPPYGVLDECPDYTRRNANVSVGCELLNKRTLDLETKNLKLHVFGHIHEGYGRIVRNKTTYVNASSCTSRYKAANESIVVEV